MIWDCSLYSNCKCIHVNGLPLIVNSNSALTGENVLKYGKSLVLKYQNESQNIPKRKGILIFGE